MTRCVILGGAGFLGHHVGRAMAQAGFEVWSVDHSAGLPKEEAQWLAGQITADFADVEGWSGRTGPVDVVVHLASNAVPATAQEDPVADAQTNLVGSLRLIQGLRRLPRPPRVLFASSGGAVYGVPQAVPLDENHPTLPLGAYGVTKLALEHHLRIAQALYGIEVRILRLSNPFGEWQRPCGVQGVIAVFAYRALKGQPLDVWGDGSVVRDFIYGGDVGRAFVAAATHQGPSRIFNIGEGTGHSINHIIRTLEHLLGCPIQRRVHAPRPFDPPVNVLDIRRARAELGWSPSVALEEGMARTLEWLRTLP